MQLCTMQVHDIEDLASEGRRLSACPYFASKEFAHDAEIVFCPYSYLVRPRTSVQFTVGSDYSCAGDSGLHCPPYCQPCGKEL